jgi:hypothetical protein
VDQRHGVHPGKAQRRGRVRTMRMHTGRQVWPEVAVLYSDMRREKMDKRGRG